MLQLSRIEEFQQIPTKSGVNKANYVILSFRTEFRGIWQCKVRCDGIEEFVSEPPFESLKEDEQRDIKLIAKIIFYFTFGEIPNF